MTCRVCDKVIEADYFQFEDKTRGGKVVVCKECEKIESRCFACSLPIKANPTKLTDGRVLCAADAKDAILEDSEAKTLCLSVREELDRSFSRYLTFPSTNVVLTIVDRFTLESLFKSPGYGKRCTSVFGATSSHDVGDDRHAHVINILSGLSKARLQAVAAHEFSHTWLNDNLSPARLAALSPDAVEGFCELMAYEYMDLQKNEFEKKTIRENAYTRGQVDAFLAAENLHGFNSIVEWVKSGESAKLDAQDPDGVRQVTAKSPAASIRPASSPVRAASVTLAALPEKLMLKGISGTAARRFAIINDRTFGATDKATIRLVNTNVTVRCLEVRANSVVIQIEGTDEKQELFLSEASRR